MIFKRFAWFICVVFTAKKTSSNWMVVGFGVTVPASIVIRLLSNSFVVTSFNHGNCVGVKFRWYSSESPLSECCDLGASKTWRENRAKNNTLVSCFVLTFESNCLFVQWLYIVLFRFIQCQLNKLWVCWWRSHPLFLWQIRLLKCRIMIIIWYIILVGAFLFY